MATTTVPLATDLSSLEKKERVTNFTPTEAATRWGGSSLLLLLFITLIVLFPILWVVSMSLSPCGLRPLTLTLIPADASFAAYAAVIDKPTNNPVGFWTLTRNSLALATSVSVLSVLIRVFCAVRVLAIQIFRAAGVDAGHHYRIDASDCCVIGAAVCFAEQGAVYRRRGEF